MIYVYAIIQPPGDVAFDVCGLGEQPLRALVTGDIGCAYSVHAPPAPTPTPEDLWRHEQVVEALMRDRPLLPARFGTTFRDEGQLEQVLGRHGARLAAALDRVEGCVELGLRVFHKGAVASAAESGPTGSSGRAYMQARLAAEQQRRQAEQQAERLAAQLHDALAPLSRDHVRRVLPAPELLMTAAYLVPRELRERFGARARELAEAHRELRVLCTGPWPPYHFVPSLELSEAVHA